MGWMQPGSSQQRNPPLGLLRSRRRIHSCESRPSHLATKVARFGRVFNCVSVQRPVFLLASKRNQWHYDRMPIVRLAITLALFAYGAPSGLSDILTANFIPRGAVWRFLDDGSNQGTSWTGLAFSDASWEGGPARLGYGGDGEVTTVSYGPNSSAKYITTYFRRSFDIADRSIFRALKLRLVCDDGAVVYLNAAEIF